MNVDSYVNCTLKYHEMGDQACISEPQLDEL